MRIFILPLLWFSPLIGVELSIGAKSAILMDAKSGHILYEKGALEEQYPASITKILTTLIIIEAKGDALHEEVVVPREAVGTITPAEKRKAGHQLPSHWVEVGSSHVGLKVGEVLTVEALLHGVMLESGNDASNVLAGHVAGDIPTFIAAMNIRAAQIGCKKTHFTNPHGLHHPKHVTCAYDMALMTKEAMKDPLFRKLVATQYWKKGATNKQGETTWVQHNQMVRRSKKHYYPKSIGVKTGRTDDAGTTYVGAAQDGERELIAVVIGCENFPQAYTDTKKLFEAAFNEQRVQHRLVRAGHQPFTTDVGRCSLVTCTKEDAVIEYLPSYAPHVHTEVVWQALEAPIAVGEEVGQVCVMTEEGQIMTSVPLYAEKGVKTPFRFSEILYVSDGVKGGLVASVAGVFLMLALWKRRK